MIWAVPNMSLQRIGPRGKQFEHGRCGQLAVIAVHFRGVESGLSKNHDG
jgi:hypothetical protein